MKVFLDDIRMPIDASTYMNRRITKLNVLYLETWVVVRNYEEFVKVVENNIDTITHVSFDHDLAPEHYQDCDRQEFSMYETYEEKTGYDAAKWMKEFYKEKQTSLPVMFVHSMNPSGTDNIINLFK